MLYLRGEDEKKAIVWMTEAAKVAEKALCLEAKCGTVIVMDDQIIGEGYNAPPLDKEENRTCKTRHGRGKPKYDQTCCVHSEWRAILDALKKNKDKIVGATLYFTRVDDNGVIKRSGDPYCTVCSRLALDVGINKFVLWQLEGMREYITDEYNKLSYEYIHE